ncbi:type II CRISPR-associated endonuclease Cas1 [Candidatus Sulfidibacterium hydrothermale]|uniref:type II CRISPR-associated endonuclease Cas1 n=1 Tax=Candidatus Sulfidibacterium hydrothermale TaxID=2875962 RepID=UPI001F0A10E2|nr:type II CRISPR-associated endonuclease Cas1 [Candidatus Sulfidibacterium hydrothermale]UBM62076.1 type II CRISPR-associated endonuclease Cas1 [Candidatus Sulfidibacterium hydrothermale]
MIKRTLYFGNPCYLFKNQNQLVVELENGEKKTVPIEDIGIIILDHYQIKITQPVLQALVANNTAVLVNDAAHLPLGLMLPMASHNTYTEKLHFQVNATKPLKKNLWQQTIKQKIRNQASLLRQEGVDTENMDYWASQVKSGDPDNYESRAAAYYWRTLFDVPFKRERFGIPPNNLLNYGYAILRAVVARSLVASGMLPALGIHHRNKYDAYCLADDIMEPYRPYVDRVVLSITDREDFEGELTTDVKRRLLQIPVVDVTINGKSGPLMVGMQQTTASLMRCFEGGIRKISYPDFD